MEARYIVDEIGKRTGVILSVDEYERMIEDLEDVRLYDEGKAALQRSESEVVPLEQAMREIREGKVTGD
jgi:PHD/YefM family antitoxin component YafN of YafNO toxin-antitoxin module